MTREIGRPAADADDRTPSVNWHRMPNRAMRGDVVGFRLFDCMRFDTLPRTLLAFT
jgi:hypothetical protein